MSKRARVICPIHAQNFDLAGIGRGQAFADFNRGGFPRPVGAEEPEAFAFQHVEIKSVNGNDVLVPLNQLANAKSRFLGAFTHRKQYRRSTAIYEQRRSESLLRRTLSFWKPRTP